MVRWGWDANIFSSLHANNGLNPVENSSDISPLCTAESRAIRSHSKYNYVDMRGKLILKFPHFVLWMYEGVLDQIKFYKVSR